MKLKALSLAILLLTGSSLVAQAPAVTSFTGGTQFSGFSSDETVGWRFQTTQAITVSALGWWDADISNPLNATHEVGIWSDTGTLLASITVLTTSALNGSWRYENLTTPLDLATGTFFRIGGRDLVADLDNYISGVAGITTTTGVTFNQSIVSPNAAGFAFPSVNSGGQGRFGPNFIFTISAVPEPTTWALIGIGVTAGLGGVWRYRRRKTLELEQTVSRRRR